MDFDFVARPYSLLERIVFGRALERCRTSLLPMLPPSRKALFIGEGDGRFLLRFLHLFPDADIDVVEQSAGMIQLAQNRIRRVRTTGRIRFRHEDVLTADSLAGPYDLIVTHFVLDVLTEAKLTQLVAKMRDAAPNARWLVSEFQSSRGPKLARYATQWCLTLMYAFFRVTAGVQVRSIPGYAPIFARAGMSLQRKNVALGGFISSELWEIGRSDDSCR
jgi:SAM-dependent methyltransferase